MVEIYLDVLVDLQMALNEAIENKDEAAFTKINATIDAVYEMLADTMAEE